MKKSNSSLALLALVLLLLLPQGCARPPAKSAAEAMRKAAPPASLRDDLDLSSLRQGIAANLALLQKKKGSEILVFGPRSLTRSQYARVLGYTSERIEDITDKDELIAWIEANFEFLEVYGAEKWGEVLVTGYYDPVLEGSRTPTSRFSRAIYTLPRDLVSVDLESFAGQFPELRGLLDTVTEQKSRTGVLRGRLVPVTEGADRVVPYFSRREIDGENRLAGQGLELAWLEPIDAFFLQIQGSGIIRFADGTSLHAGYAAQNGHPYVAIGKFLWDAIPREKMSMQAIRRHLLTLSQEERQSVFDKNPSYVFFRELPGNSITFLGTEVVAGRTIATDQKFFPKGALAYLELEKPVFADGQAEEPEHWERAGRFVLDQDTGGAIRGTGRVDLYWGQGSQAAQAAGVMKSPGRLYYLFPKEHVLQAITEENL